MRRVCDELTGDELTGSRMVHTPVRAAGE